MKTLLLAIALALLAGTLLSLGMAHDTGYVRVSIGHYLIETNFWVALALVLAVALALHWLLLAAGRLRVSPSAVSGWLQQRAQQRARRRTTQGLLELAEGNWQQARKLLESAAPNTDTPLINYLSAAEAAHEQGAHDEADELLREAFDSTEGADLAVGLTQAKLQLAAGKLEQALATLLRLRRKAPQHPFVLKQLKNAYEALEDWQALGQLVPELRRLKIMDEASLNELEQDVWLRVLDQAAEQIERQPAEHRNINHLDRIWDELPSARRNDEAIIQAYASHLARLGEPGRAETLLRKVLRKRWSDQLVNLYGRIPGDKADEQLIMAENWLKERPNNPQLMLALGRLSLRNELWGKAREYLEASLRLQRTRETAAELCRLNAHLGDYEQSVKLLRQGVLLENAGLPELPMPPSPRRRNRRAEDPRPGQ